MIECRVCFVSPNLIALAALELLDGRMDGHVCAQVALLRKPLGEPDEQKKERKKEKIT